VAKTVSTDIIIPEIYSRYLTEEQIYTTGFYRSGLVRRDSLIDGAIAGGGQTFNVPFFKRLTAGATAIQDGTDITAAKQTAAKQTGIRIVEGRNDSYEELAGHLAGEDLQANIQNQLGHVWELEQQAALSSIIQGVVADNVANDSGDMVEDITTTGTVADANLIDSDAVIDGYYKRGDKSTADIIIMHTVPYSRLVKLNLIDFAPTNVQDIGFGTFLNMTVVVSDEVPAPTVTNKQYWTIIASAGAFGYGESSSNITNFELDRDASAGLTEVVTRRAYNLHPMGHSWTNSSIAGQTPTRAELATAANWDRVYDLKNTGFTVLKTNG
jgi:hypothetical protein